VKEKICFLLFFWGWSVGAFGAEFPIVALRGFAIDGASKDSQNWQTHARMLREGDVDWIFLKTRAVDSQSREDLEVLLQVLDQCLPPATISLEMDFSNSRYPGGPEDMVELISQMERHPSIARFREKFCLLFSSASEMDSVPQLFLELEQRGLAGKLVLFSEQSVDSDSMQFLVPAINVSAFEKEEFEERIGFLRMLSRPVAVTTAWEEAAWIRLRRFAENQSCALVLMGPVPQFSEDFVLPNAFTSVVKDLKEGYVDPPVDIKTVIKKVRGEDALVVNLTRLTSKRALDVTVKVSIEEPFRVHPQKAIMEVGHRESMQFFLVSPGEANPGNYRVRVEASAEGYRTARSLFHRVPLIGTTMVVSPIVDGDLSDWGGVRRVTLRDKEGNERGDFMLAWERQYLYLAFHLKDVDVGQKCVEGEIPSHDCIRIGIDSKWDQRFEGYLGDDFEFIMAFTPQGPKVLPSEVMLRKLPLQETRLAVGRSHGDLIYELALAPSSRSFLKMAPRTVIGLAARVQATDLDTGEPVILEWGDGLHGERSPYLFGMVGLSGAR